MQKNLWMRRLAAWLSRGTGTGAASSTSSRRRKARSLVGLEVLEDRNLLSAGTLDLQFNGAGFNTTGFNRGGTNNDQAAGSAIQADGKVVVVGSAEGNANLGNYAQTAQSPIALDNPYSSAVAAGDFNGDGNNDVAVAYYDNGTVRVFLGNGNGTFQAGLTPINLGLGASPGPGTFSIAAGKFHDVGGNVDLVVGNIKNQSISILSGNGNGTFAVQTLSLTQGVETHSPFGLAVGNLGTGHQSIVTANADGTISVVLGNGNGTFAAPSTTINSTTDNLRNIRIVDLGRGNLDLVTVSASAEAIVTIRGNGNGTFDNSSVAFTPVSNFPPFPTPIGLDVGDFNFDGKIDVVTANRDTNNISVLLGNGNGTFGAATTFAASTGGYSATVADFNRDGIPDVMTAGLSGQIDVLLGNGDGTFKAPKVNTVTGQILQAIAPVLDNTTNVPAIVAPGFDLPGRQLFVFQNTSTTGASDFAIARYNTDGTLDTTFGVGGKQTIGFNLGGADEDRAFSVSIDANGKIIVAGFAQTTGINFDFAVTRLTASGQIDNTFGPNGNGKIHFGFNLNPNGPQVALATSSTLAIQPNGAIIVGGQVQRTNTNGFSMAVARLTANGTLDPAFGSGPGPAGTFVLPIFGTAGNPNSENDGVDGIVVQPDGNIVVSGFAGGPTSHINFIAAARLTPTGALDGSFNLNGAVRGEFAVNLNLNPGGENDDQGTGVALQADGKIVISGFAQTTNSTPVGAAVGSYNFAAVRLNPDGTLDPTFNTFGALPGTVNFGFNLNPGGQNDDEANSVAIQKNGSIVLAGFAQRAAGDEYDVAVARLLPNGQLDSTFGIVGITGNTPGQMHFNTNANPGGNNEDVGLSVVIDNRQTADLFGVGDGFSNIIVSGFATTPNGNDFMVSRVLALNTINIAGDWNGDGVQTPGIYDPRTSNFFLRNSNSTGGADIVTQITTINVGGLITNPAGFGWIPVVGDWTGTGHDGVGLYDPVGSTFFLWDTATPGALTPTPDHVITFGPGLSGYKPVAGQFVAGGHSSVGVWDPQSDRNANGLSTFILDNTLAGQAVTTVDFGPANNGVNPPVRTVPLMGDWTNKGFDSVGVWQPSTSTFSLKNTNTSGAAPDITFQFGPPNGGGTITNVVTGRWVVGATNDGVGVVDPLAVAGQAWSLRNTLTTGPADISFTYGTPGLAGSPQLAAAAGGGASVLTDSQLAGIVANALVRFQAAGASAAQLSKLQSLTFLITNLSSGEAGLTAGNTVYIDSDANGYGWFVDASPGQDQEFQDGAALPGSAASGHLDLLTVVLHEMGHGLGLQDIDSSGDLMSSVLNPGVRRVDVLDALYTQGY